MVVQHLDVQNFCGCVQPLGFIDSVHIGARVLVLKLRMGTWIVFQDLRFLMTLYIES